MSSLCGCCLTAKAQDGCLDRSRAWFAVAVLGFLMGVALLVRS